MEISFTEIRFKEDSSEEVRPVKFGSGEVGLTKLPSAEVLPTEIYLNFRIFLPPLIPLLHSFLEHLDLFLIRHEKLLLIYYPILNILGIDKITKKNTIQLSSL
jgi:hypothetical protein